MNKPSPLITIITPSYNRATMILDAIESVLAQDYRSIEHIIMDGESTDGTLDILGRFPSLTVVSESDNGMYDALNNGIRLAKGNIIGFLNSDDRYPRNVFASVMGQFERDPEIWAVCGGISYFTSGNQLLRRLPPVGMENLIQRITIGVPGINAWFFRRDVFERLGFFNLSYRIAADRDFLLRFACEELSIRSIDQIIYEYRSHPGSATLYNARKPEILKENLDLAARYSDLYSAPPALRRACREWELKYLMAIIGRFVRQRNWEAAYRYFKHAQTRHWWWIFYFICVFPLEVLTYLFSGRLTLSPR